MLVLIRSVQQAFSLISRPALFLPALMLLCLAVSAGYVDSRLPNPDEGMILTGAARICRGDVYYRDLDSFQFPGSHYLLAIGMKIFGEHLSVARWMAAGFYCAIVASLYLAALHLMERRWAALFGLSLLSFKFVAWPMFSAYFYSDIAFLGACVAIAALVADGFPRASLRLLLAGAGIGVAVACKQNVGIYLGAASAAALLFPRLVMGIRPSPPRRSSREVALLFLGAAAVLVPFFGYFAAHGLLGRMLSSGLIEPVTGYGSGVPFWTPLAWWRLGELRGFGATSYQVNLYWHMLMRHQLPGPGAYPFYWLAGEIFSRLVYTSIPVAFVWILTRRIRSRTEPDDRAARTSLLAFLALAVVATAFPRSDMAHVLPVYPVVVLLLFALVASGPNQSHASRRLWVVGGGVALLLALCLVLTATHRAHLSHRVRLARAEVWVEPPEAWIEPLVEYVSEHARDGDHIFVYGHEAQLYFLTGRFSPWRYSQLYLGQEGGDGGIHLVELLRRVPPRLVLRGVLIWPGTPSLPDYAPRLHEYLHSEFEIDENFFVDHPVPGGTAPPGWVISVLHPRPPKRSAP
jgi:hypothetical protein